MPTAEVLPYIPDSRRRSGLRANVWLPIGVVVALLAIAALAPRIQPGPFINRVTISNASVYAFDVEVAGAKADDWTLLEVATTQGSTSVGAVFDEGSTWTFRFSVEGRVMGEVVESRSDLSSAGWRVVIPARYAATLQREGVPPTA